MVIKIQKRPTWNSVMTKPIRKTHKKLYFHRMVQVFECTMGKLVAIMQLTFNRLQ